MINKQSKKTIVELMDGEIKRLREAGYSLGQIAEIGGVSRERIRQVINRFYPGTKTKLLKETEAAKLMGLSKNTLIHLRRKGTIHPVKIGLFYRYNDETLEEVRAALYKPCRICGNRVPRGHRNLCENCASMMKNAKLRLSLPGEREKHLKSVKKWKTSNRERVRQYHYKKSWDKYKEKVSRKNYEISIYKVRLPHSEFQVGEEFKAIGFKNNGLLLADNRIIPAIKTIKIAGPKGVVTLKKLGVSPTKVI